MLQKIIFTWWIKFAIFLSTLVLVNCTTWIVTSLNQNAGLYPTDADSIGIPIVVTVVASLVMLPIFLAVSLLSNNGFSAKLKSKGLPHVMATRVAILLLYGASLLFAVYGIVYWTFPGHYFIAVSYMILSMVLLTGLVYDWRDISRVIRT